MKARLVNLLFVLLWAVLIVRPCLSADIKVLAIGATTPTLRSLIPEFERTTGHKVSIWFGPPAPLVQKLAAGEPTDVVLIGSPRYDDLVKAKTIDEGFVLAKFGVGVGYQKGAPKPQIDTPEVLKTTLLAAKSLVGLPFDNGSIGTETMIGFRKLGIADQMIPKYKFVLNGASVVQAIAKGEAELGFSVFADLAGSSEISYAGPYPAEVQTYVDVHASSRIGGPSEAAGREFLQFVRKNATPELLKASWLLPGGN